MRLLHILTQMKDRDKEYEGVCTSRCLSLPRLLFWTLENVHSLLTEPVSRKTDTTVLRPEVSFDQKKPQVSAQFTCPVVQRRQASTRKKQNRLSMVYVQRLFLFGVLSCTDN